MNHFFKPEFVNRIDEVIVFNALDTKVMKRIADKFLDQLRKRLADKDIELEVTDAAKENIILYGTDPSFGARPMKRHIQREIETLVAKKILEDPTLAGKTLIVDAEDGEYEVRVKSADAMA